MSRVVRFHELGGPEVLVVEHQDIPSPGPGEVVMVVEAIGLNRADVMFRTGRYLEKARLPSRIGFEASGVVLSCGEGVTAVAPGDRVATLPGFDMSSSGTYADHVVLPAQSLLPVPAGLSSVQASALWMAYLTAYGGVIEACKVRPGEWIAVTAATSSVGQAAIQIAVQQGAKPIAITLTSERREELLAMGARAVIAVQETPLQHHLEEITNGDLACAFDAVGGSQVLDLVSAMKPGGTLVLHGALSDEDTPFPLKLALRRSLAFRGYVYTEVTGNPFVLSKAQAFIAAGIQSGAIQPVIDAQFSLADVVDAHRHLEAGKHFGKIVLTP